MNIYGLQLYEAFNRIKKSTMSHLKNENMKDLKPHEFFMLNTIIHSYNETKLKATSLNIPPPPGVKISEISRFSCISMPGVSQTISHMVKSGYVERITTEKDRRLVYVNVTSKGKNLVDSISFAAFHLYDQAAELLGPKDTETLIDLLDKLTSCFTSLQEKENSERNE